MIENVHVYGLNRAIKASGYPMMINIDDDYLNSEPTEKDIDRALRLGSAKPASGHNCFLKGIQVTFDMTISQAMAQQIKRYHFFDYVSSTSTMHCILKMDVASQCNSRVSMDTIVMLRGLIRFYNNYDKMKDAHFEMDTTYRVDTGSSKEDLFECIIYNIPSGFELKSFVTTNYLQLVTMYNQRHNHKLKEWRLFCEKLLKFPLFKEIIDNQRK